nr:phosphatase domain-containing protein [Rubellimicrobium mesophilum]
MTPRRARGSWGRAVTGILRLLGRPVRRAQGGHGVVLEPYRGYGTRSEVFLIGRVFRQSQAHPKGERGLRSELRDIGRRLARHAIAGAVLTARFQGAEDRVRTDADGYFRVHLRPRTEPSPEADWHAMELTLESPQTVRAEGRVYIPPPQARFVVISDIDDTIMRTGVANKLGMLWRLFVADAQSRVAFPGVAALYRALHAGPSGGDGNPMLYVSRAPWGIYDMLDEFFRLHGIPVGPVLFLREWGLSWRHPLPRKATDHKEELIGHMLELYDDLPFVLIGDSGQHDPEVYRKIVDAHPGRVLAVYIRNVSRDRRRIAEIEALAVAVAASGSGLVLAADSLAMARHAEGLGLVEAGTVAAAAGERREQGERAAPEGTRDLREATPERTAGAVDRGELRDLLDPGAPGAPANVVVEPEARAPSHRP